MTNGAQDWSKAATMTEMLRTMIPSQREREKIDPAWLETINKLGWDSNPFLAELFSDTTHKMEKDGEGKISFKPTSETVLGGYDNGTSFLSAAQYFFGVPIAWFATEYAQEAFIQDTVGAIALKSELMQLGKTIEDYTNLMMLMQMYPSEEKRADIQKLMADREGYKAKLEALESEVKGLKEKHDVLTDDYERLKVVQSGLYKSMLAGPAALHRYVSRLYGISPEEPIYAPPAATAATT